MNAILIASWFSSWMQHNIGRILDITLKVDIAALVGSFAILCLVLGAKIGSSK